MIRQRWNTGEILRAPHFLDMTSKSCSFRQLRRFSLYGGSEKMEIKDSTCKKKSYRWCIVPLCKSTSISTPDKRFVSVPKDKKQRQSWLKAVKRDFHDKIPSPKSTLYCCEDHFNMEEDMENYMRFKMIGGYLKAKRNVVPHIFENQKHQPTTNANKTTTKINDQHLANHSNDSQEMYYIVEFESTGDIATVPQKWTEKSPDGVICLWPPRNVLYAIKTCKEPNLSAWRKHKIQILRSFGTYEEARKAEQEAQYDLDFHAEPENDLGRGKRKKFQKRLLDDVDDNNVTPALKCQSVQRRDDVEDEPSTHPIEVVDNPPTNILSLDGDEASQQQSPNETIETEADGENVILAASLQEKNNDSSVLGNELQQTHCCCNKEMMERLLQEVASLRKELRDALDVKAPDLSLATEVLIGDGLRLELPLKSLPEVDALERELQYNHDKRKKLVENMVKVGGTNVGDAIKRLLRGLFSDGLAQNFSWEGRKGKRELKGMIVINLVFAAIQNGFGKKGVDATLENIKHRIREWFRHACARNSSKEKRRETLAENSVCVPNGEVVNTQGNSQAPSGLPATEREKSPTSEGDCPTFYEPSIVPLTSYLSWDGHIIALTLMAVMSHFIVKPEIKNCKICTSCIYSSVIISQVKTEKCDDEIDIDITESAIKIEDMMECG